MGKLLEFPGAKKVVPEKNSDAVDVVDKVEVDEIVNVASDEVVEVVGFKLIDKQFLCVIEPCLEGWKFSSLSEFIDTYIIVMTTMSNEGARDLLLDATPDLVEADPAKYFLVKSLACQKVNDVFIDRLLEKISFERIKFFSKLAVIAKNSANSKITSLRGESLKEASPEELIDILGNASNQNLQRNPAYVFALYNAIASHLLLD